MKVEINLRKGKELPEDWCQDSFGNPIRDPNLALTSGYLLPLGGREEQSGYKGTGLAVMTEIFCGILAGTH